MSLSLSQLVRNYESLHGGRNLELRRFHKYLRGGGDPPGPMKLGDKSKGGGGDPQPAPSDLSISLQNIVVGIEIEGCFEPRVASTDLEYFNVEDEAVTCERGQPFEFISIPLRLDTFKRADFQKEYQYILESNFGCDLNTDNNISCGTHVHMSMRGFSKSANPYFRYFLLMEWIKAFDTFKRTYYQHQDRHQENTYCEPNTLDCMYRDKGKTKMIHFVSDPDTDDWHVEFRGFGEIVSKGSHALKPEDPDYWPPHNTSAKFNSYISDLTIFFTRAAQAYKAGGYTSNPDALIDQLASFAKVHSHTSPHTFLTKLAASLTQAQYNPLDPMGSSPQAIKLLAALNLKLAKGASRKQGRR